MRIALALPFASLALVSAACSDAPTVPGPVGGIAAASAGRDAPTTAAAVTVVMSNLDNPRGLAWGPDGALYVAEAGTPAVVGPCVTTGRGNVCFSGTGAISRLWKGTQERVVSGLPSTYTAGPNDVSGPHDISFQGKGNGYITIGWGGPPAARAALGPAGAAMGHLIRLTPDGSWKVVADIAGFEQENNPAGGPIDSNPYGVLAEPGRAFVADAGGNSLVDVSANGAISLVATFPSVPAPPPFNQSEAVPTEVERGPDGALYVSTLSGVPFLDGNARIYRVAPGSAPTVYAGGFKTITDFDFAPDGSIYLVQFASGPLFFAGPGSLVHVATDGTRTTILDDLTTPTGVLVGPDGAVYVSNFGAAPGIGQVLRVIP